MWRSHCNLRGAARSGGQPPVHAAPARVLPNTSARPPGPLLPPRTGRAILRSTQMSASSDQSSSSRATSLRRQDFILSSRKALSRPVYGRINIHTLKSLSYLTWFSVLICIFFCHNHNIERKLQKSYLKFFSASCNVALQMTSALQRALLCWEKVSLI